MFKGGKMAFNQEEKFKKDKNNYSAIMSSVGREKVLYVTLPYAGCTHNPKCIFCGVQERKDRSLKIDKSFGREVVSIVTKCVDEYSPDSLVLYNGGNILRPEEMFQSAVLVEIPKFVAGHPTCNVYEIESRADDILKFGESIDTIRRNLGPKKLRVRLGIEYYDDGLLWRHNKGMTCGQIDKTVLSLNESGIEWNGYVLFGGLDLKRRDAKIAAKRTAKFMIDNGAFKVSINGVFMTRGLERSFGRRIYVPGYSELIELLAELIKYRNGIKSSAIFKVGFEEEDIENIVRFPYLAAGISMEDIKKRLADFNITQNLASMK